jgi:hypothetical protein
LAHTIMEPAESHDVLFCPPSQATHELQPLDTSSADHLDITEMNGSYNRSTHLTITSGDSA